MRKDTNHSNNERELTFHPGKTLKEIRAVKWAHWKSAGKEAGLAKNLAETFVFTSIFAGFFQICSLIAAFFLKLLGI